MSEQGSIPEALANAVADTIVHSLKKSRGVELTPVGFEWAFWFRLRQGGWKVSRSDSNTWLWSYVGAPYGHPDLGWSAFDAEYLADRYMAEYGEAP